MLEFCFRKSGKCFSTYIYKLHFEINLRNCADSKMYFKTNKKYKNGF